MLINEEDIVLEARIQVRLEAQLDDDGVVVAVDVCVDAVQALEHVADEGGKRLGEGDADARGEHGFVVYVGLDPRHEVLDVLRGGHLGGLLVRLRVLPEVLESGGGLVRLGLGMRVVVGLLVGGFHLWTALGRAELCDGAVEEVDLVVEVDDYHASSAWHPSWSTVSYH
jgi:hypothetical protein